MQDKTFRTYFVTNNGPRKHQYATTDTELDRLRDLSLIGETDSDNLK